MRRITTGIVGGPILGQLSAFDSAVSGVVPNANISLAPNGTGEVFIESHIQVRANETIKLMDSDNSNFVGLKSPSTVASDITYTFPGTITFGLPQNRERIYIVCFKNKFYRRTKLV